jgi:hypothetical protein
LAPSTGRPVRPDTLDGKRLFIFDADKHYIELFGRADILSLFLAVVDHPHPAKDQCLAGRKTLDVFRRYFLYAYGFVAPIL